MRNWRRRSPGIADRMMDDHEMTPETESVTPAESSQGKSKRGKPRREIRSPQNTRRHQARELALQVLYEVDVTDHSQDEVLARARAQHATPDDTFEYLVLLVHGIHADSERIDRHISAAAPAFPIDQLPPVDRNVLRVAIFELLNQEDVPPKAAINEAIDLAKRYGGDNSGKFINGVLGTVFSRINSERSKPDENPSTSTI